MYAYICIYVAINKDDQNVTSVKRNKVSSYVVAITVILLYVHTKFVCTVHTYIVLISVSILCATYVSHKCKETRT